MADAPTNCSEPEVLDPSEIKSWQPVLVEMKKYHELRKSFAKNNAQQLFKNSWRIRGAHREKTFLLPRYIYIILIYYSYYSILVDR